jgi:adenosylmethionine-8-amino-7-oxononanoate aminotransferase
MLAEVVHISPCYAYRGKRPGESDEEYGLRVADELESAIDRLGPGNVLAFVAETVVGTTSGALPAVPGYFKRIREICDRHGVFLILDEVFCGMGRTGSLHACSQEGVAPDLITLAKGLGAGYQPIGAVLVSGRIFDVIEKGSGAFKGGFTYSGHATACAAALAVQTVIREERLVENVARQGRFLNNLLTERFGNHANIGDIRGRGLMQTIELVEDRTSKDPFDPGLKLYERIFSKSMKAGLICWPGGGTADGRKGDHVVVAPPYIVGEKEIEEIVDRLGSAVDAALAELA